jgi:hypothetical protein
MSRSESDKPIMNKDFLLKEGKENDVVKWLFEYGSSATKNSSIFIKYS